MRCLNRNKATFYCALYASREPMLDSSGNDTGQYAVKYANPIRYAGNISAAKGETSTRQFGEDERYDRVIVLDDPDTPIDENAVLWIETKPMIAANGRLAVNADGEMITPWDYIVKRVARSLNSVSIAVSKVHVNG